MKAMMKAIIFLTVLCVATSFAIAKPSRPLSYVNNVNSRQSVTSTYSTTAIAADGAAQKKESGGASSVATSSFNLAKSIIGAGVLAIPGGVSFFSDSPAALFPACGIAAVFGLAAAYTFSSIGRVCKEYDAKSFQEAWTKAIGPKTAGLISGAITALCMLASLAFSIIIADSFTALFTTFNLPAVISTRSNVLLLLTTLVLYPLCSLKNLSSLAPFSLLGLSGTLYTTIFMGIRYFDKSYSVGGKFFEQIVAKPVFNTRGPYQLNHLTFILLSMFSTAYIAHYNAPQMYNELKDNTMGRFNQVVGNAFALAILCFCFVMCTGFLTFGGATAGFVLNNYANTDRLATLARFAIGLALLTGYPFTFSALREGILDLKGVTDEQQRDKMKGPIAVVGLAAITGLALVLKDVGFVVSLSGALFGCPLMLIVPAIMNIASINKKNDGKGKIEKLVNYGLIGVGGIMTVLGVAISVAREMGKI
jgi:amino acid permease